MTDKTATNDPLDFLGGYIPTLDKTRDYGTVHGERSEHNECYVQEGFHFDAHGVFLPALVSEADKKGLAQRARLARAQKAAQDAMKAVLDGDDSEQAKALKVVIEKNEGLKAGDIDLKAWAATGGQEPKVQFALISEAVAAVYGDKPSNRAAAIEIITKGKALSK